MVLCVNCQALALRTGALEFARLGILTAVRLSSSSLGYDTVSLCCLAVTMRE